MTTSMETKTILLESMVRCIEGAYRAYKGYLMLPPYLDDAFTVFNALACIRVGFAAPCLSRVLASMPGSVPAKRLLEGSSNSI
ncbi:hypothetical protein [Infirmifilum sp.]|uniref:hypothetical protein n=1 Tax=Infirmifilum sp. TaxID=2856575 RepID=UPI003D115C38